MDPSSLNWLKQKFSNYYKSASLEYPKRFGRREFGFMFFDKPVMLRHLSFNTRREIKDFLTSNAPTHVYYSSAYYEKPGAQSMNEKLWLGADLIFDLDADHLERAKNLPYKEALEVVKSETLKLLENFLLTDFGFDEKFIQLNFSGGRGYHIHVSDPKILSLDSYARREIIDYLTGEGLDWSKIFHEAPYTIAWTGKRRISKKTVEMPSAEKPGWEAKIGKGILRLLDSLESDEKKLAVTKLQSYGVKKRVAEGIYSDLFEGSPGKRGVDKIRNAKLDIFSEERKLRAFLKIVKEELGVSLRGEADEPVTSDTKRLIRLPASLHGKTGLKALGMKIDELKEFEPLSQAVAFSSMPTKIKVLKPVKFELGNEKFSLGEGIVEVPEYAAVFLIARGWAEKS